MITDQQIFKRSQEISKYLPDNLTGSQKLYSPQMCRIIVLTESLSELSDYQKLELEDKITEKVFSLFKDIFPEYSL